MARKKTDNALAGELSALLVERFPGIEVEVAHIDRWGRMCATFRWSGFAPLLPEERFHRLATVIPADLREERMAGFVWLELAPGETTDAFLALPRSEDIDPKEKAVYAHLVRVGFFDALSGAMKPSPEEKCAGDFALAEKALSGLKLSAAKARDAKLLFIRHGVYCDCQVLETVQPELEKLYAGAA